MRSRRPRARHVALPADAGAVAEAVSLLAAIAPTIVMAVRAAAAGWVPLFDAAYFSARSLDVGTGHNPLLGAWSMGSREVGAWVNNLGPIQLDLLAPFTRLDPYWGTAAGVAAVNEAAVVGVWLVVRRLFAPAAPRRSVAVAGSMAASVLLQLNAGSLMLIEARQQLALLLPMWVVLWLAAAAWHGHGWALPWLAFAGSFVLQTHFTYAYQTGAVVVAAVAACAVGHRRSLRSLGRSAAIAAAVTIACWAMPVWDQFAGRGNLLRVVGEAGGSARSVGVRRGLRILAETGFVPPFFVPGSMGDLLRAGPGPSTGSAIVALALWLGALLALAVRGARRRSPLGAVAGIATVSVLASGFAAAKIPPTEQFGVIAQNYYWAWPLGIFAATAFVGAATRWLLDRPDGARQVAATPATAVALAVATIAGATPLLGPTTELPETDHEWTMSRRIVRPLIEEFGAALDRYAVRGPVVVDLTTARHARYTLLAELLRRGIDFRFAAGATDLSRFGPERCDRGAAAALITLREGADAVRLDTPGDLLAAEPGLSVADAERSEQLAAEFGEAIRDNVVTADVDAIAPGRERSLLVQVIAVPGLPARRLSALLTSYRHFAIVTVPDELTPALAEWRALEAAADADRMSITLEQLPAGRPDRCDDVVPGESFRRQRGWM